jgi:hypothetical protein
VKRETKDTIRQYLDDAAGYAKQARAAVQAVDDASFQSYLRGARFALDAAEKYFMEGMENE